MDLKIILSIITIVMVEIGAPHLLRLHPSLPPLLAASNLPAII